jgi:4-amino-4-deoxy-L-arabinose transferase-like glycosyltransferase
MQPLLATTGYALVALVLFLGVNRSRLSLCALILGAGLLRLSSALDLCLHPWDERYHALVAKNSIAEPLAPQLYPDKSLPYDNSNWTKTSTWLHKPPLTTWVMAGSIRLFGTTSLVVRVPSILFGCISAYLCFLIGSSLISTRVGLWSGALFSLNGHLIELASGRTATDHVDALLVALVLLGAFAAVQMARTTSMRWAILCGLSMGLGFLTKAWPSLIILLLAVAAILTLSTERGYRQWILFAIVAFVALLVAGPWQLYIHSHFPEVVLSESRSHWDHFNQNIEEHGRPWYYYVAQFPMIHGEAAPIAVIAATIILFQDKVRSRAFLLLWFLVPFILFSFATSKMPAYTAIAAPAIFILIGIAGSKWWDAFKERSTRRWLPWLGCVLLLALPLRFSIDRVKPFHTQEPTYVIPSELYAVTSKTVVVGFPDPISLMFHTPIAGAYDELDSLSTVMIQSKGYLVLKYSDGRLERR